MILNKLSEMFTKKFFENLKHRMGRLKRIMWPYGVYKESDMLEMCLDKLLPRHVEKSFENGYKDLRAAFENRTREDRHTWKFNATEYGL